MSVDLVLLAVPVLAFAVIESRRLGMRLPWIWIPLAVLLVWLGLIVGGYVAAPPWLAAQLGF